MLKIVPRWRWGAKAATPLKRRLPVSRVWVHHTAGGLPEGYHPKVVPGPQEKRDKRSERQEMRDIDTFHISRGWAGIGYLFAIAPSGRIYEGRRYTWDAIGAHTEGDNTGSVGIVLMGDFTRVKPTQPALDSLAKLIASGVRKGKLTRNVTIKGHGAAPQAATACPGTNLTDELPWVRNEVARRLRNNG